MKIFLSAPLAKQVLLFGWHHVQNILPARKNAETNILHGKWIESSCAFLFCLRRSCSQLLTSRADWYACGSHPSLKTSAYKQINRGEKGEEHIAAFVYETNVVIFSPPFPTQRKLMGSSAQNSSGVHWCRLIFSGGREIVEKKCASAFAKSSGEGQ